MTGRICGTCLLPVKYLPHLFGDYWVHEHSTWARCDSPLEGDCNTRNLPALVTIDDLHTAPEGTVFRTSTGRIGEIDEPPDGDPEVYLDGDGERILPRRLSWTGSDIFTSMTDNSETELLRTVLPARIIYTPGD